MEFNTHVITLYSKAQIYLKDKEFTLKEGNIWHLASNPFTIKIKIIRVSDSFLAVEFYSPEIRKDYPLVIDTFETFKLFVNAIINLNILYGYEYSPEEDNTIKKHLL